MPKRTSRKDAKRVAIADDLDHLVQDKREDSRATAAKVHRRQRRYKKRMTDEIARLPQDDAYDTDQKYRMGESKNMKSTIELKHLELKPSLGTYGPDDVVPDVHLLELTLTIDPKLVLIDADGMDRVFDYDPLIAEIDRLAKDGHYQTQERLMTRIVAACRAYEAIEAVELCLSKRPVLRGSGELGVRLYVETKELAEIRSKMSA